MEIILTDPLLLLWLGLLGLFVGFLTGMFGIGGAFITTPAMIILVGLDESLAVGCSMGFTLANGLLGLRQHRGRGNLEPAAMLAIAGGACLGTWLGFQFHYSLKDAVGERFDDLVNTLFIVILVPIGALVWWQSDKSRGKALLSRIKVPPMVQLRQKDLPAVSLTLLGLIGLVIGVFKGMLGIGGGIILIPILILVVGMSPHRAVVASLGMVVFSSLVGTILYASQGDIDFLLVGAMLAGSLLGVVFGTKLCHVTSAKRLKRMLALLILGFVVFLLIEVIS
ncbi:MAG: sulfite exporter TauE/SafE family protein [Pirellulaceae bacterium]